MLKNRKVLPGISNKKHIKAEVIPVQNPGKKNLPGLHCLPLRRPREGCE